MQPAPSDEAFQIEDLIKRDDAEFDRYFHHGHLSDLAHREEGHYWHLYRRHVIADQMRRFGGGPGRRFVEIGCGTGMIATYLNENGFLVDYADVHREALEYAKTNLRRGSPSLAGPVKFIRIDIATQELPGSYDGALLLDVLEHLPNDREVLERVGTQLRRERGDKIVIFTVPAFGFLWSPWDELAHHQRRYTLASATELARSAGLEVLRCTCFFFPLFFAASAVKAARAVSRPFRKAEESSAGDPGALIESMSHPALTAGMLKILEAERRWLLGRDLPVGTSILCVARA
jgi:SAM-dependent methyltransferase